MTKNILVIEDVGSVRDKIVAALNFEGFRTIDAADGEEGVGLAQEHKPDLIICDVMMPKLDGYATLTELKKNPETAAIPFIFLTAKADRDNMRQGMNLGADDYITKPFTVPELVSAVNARLAKAEMVARRYTAEIERAELTLARIARYDGVTDLPNRLSFEEELEAAIARARASGKTLAVVLVEFDGVELVREAWGYRIGDTLLKALARRMEESVARLNGSALSHIGEERFAFVVDASRLPVEAEAVSEAVFDDLARPFQVAGREIFVTANIGISLFPSDAEDAPGLVKTAGTAARWAKDLAPNRFKRFEREMSAAVIERLLGTSDLRRAIERNELEVRFRPRRNLKSGRISSVDVVPYWSHPELGLIAPERFLGLAGAAGASGAIGHWLLRTACAQNAAWQTAGHPNVRMTVRVDASQFNDPGIVETVSKALAETKVKPETIELLFDEEAILADVEAAQAKLLELKALGIALCVNDFSIREPSLRLVKAMTVDRLILKRSLVLHIADNLDDRAIVTAIISLAHSLGLKVVAEGVETEEQFRILRLRQCDEVQGYASGTPMTPAKAEMMLASRARL